jgi:N-acetylglucosaminyl-diphospho-decaprenol L-rhamnosyltransferase
MDLTISIVNAGSRDALLACLASLRRSIHGDMAVEVVVLDNASGDGSVEAVRQRFPEVEVIAQEFRAGFASNHNRVIRRTSGRYILVANPDTFSEDWCLARLVSELDGQPRVAALGPRLVYPDGRPQASAWRFPTPASCVLGLITSGKAGITQSTGAQPRRVDWLMGSAVVFRREAIEEVGLFDESFFLYFEEVDLCLRLHRAGWEMRYFPEVTVVHHKGDLSGYVPQRRINEWWRGQHQYWRKHHSAAGARVAAFAVGARYLGAAVKATARHEAGRASLMRLEVGNAWRVKGPGLREVAEAWNNGLGSARARPPGELDADGESREPRLS